MTGQRAGRGRLEHLPTLASLDRPSTTAHVRLGVIADPHVSPRAEGTPKLYHRSAERLETAFRDANARDVDAVLSVGDLTKDGAPWEFDRVDELLERLDAPFFAVPGNHDVRKDWDDWPEEADGRTAGTGPLDRFEASYTPGRLPFSTSVGPVELVGLNTAAMPDGRLREDHDGALTGAELDWLDRTLATAETAVVCCHHNTPGVTGQLDEFGGRLPGGGEMPPTEEWSFFIRNADELLDVLKAHDAPLVLTGHLHVPATGQARGIREVTLPATGSYPNAYVLVDIGPDGTTVRYVPLVGPVGATESNVARRDGIEISRFLEQFSAVQLASLPLVDESGAAKHADGPDNP